MRICKRGITRVRGARWRTGLRPITPDDTALRPDARTSY